MTLSIKRLDTLPANPLSIVCRFLIPSEHAKVKATCTSLFDSLESSQYCQYAKEASSHYRLWQQLKATSPRFFTTLYKSDTEVPKTTAPPSDPNPYLFVDDADDKSLMYRQQYRRGSISQQGILRFSGLEGLDQTSLMINPNRTSSPSLKLIGRSVKDSLVFYATPSPEHDQEAVSKQSVVIVNSQTRKVVKEIILDLRPTLAASFDLHVILHAFMTEDKFSVITNSGELKQYHSKTFERLPLAEQGNILSNQNKGKIVTVCYQYPYLLIYERRYSNEHCITYYSLMDKSTGLIYKSDEEIQLGANSGALFFITKNSLYKISLKNLAPEKPPEWVLDANDLGFRPQSKSHEHLGKNFSVSESYVALSGVTIEPPTASVAVFDAENKQEVFQYTDKKAPYMIPIDLYGNVLMVNYMSLLFRHLPTGCSAEIDPKKLRVERTPFVQEKNGQRTIVLLTSEPGPTKKKFHIQSVTSAVNLPRNKRGVPVKPQPPKPPSLLYRAIIWIRSTRLALLIGKILQYLKEKCPPCFCCKKTNIKKA